MIIKKFLVMIVFLGESKQGVGYRIKRLIYLFKHYGTTLSCYRELVYSRLATKIGIPNVGYDLAIYQGKRGVITKRCIKEIPLSMKAILTDYAKEHFASISDEWKVIYVSFFQGMFEV